MSSRVVRTRLAVPSCLYLQKMRLIGAGLLIGLLLAGCAAERSYHDGKELVKSDKVEDALTKFQLAMAQDPQNYEYRMAYLQTKERAVSNYLEKADRLADAEKTDDAEKLYQRVLAIDASSERARTGLRNLEMGKRHAQLLKDVAGAIEKNDMVTANMKLATVLTENPKSEAARALQNAIAAKNVQPPVDALLSNAYKKPITIQFKDSPLKQIFEVISRTSGLNFLFDKDVKLDQKSSIFLKDGTIESAVYYTLLTNQLEQQILDGNTILIYPNNAAKLKEYQDMVIRSFFLAYADAKVIATNLKALLKSKDIVIDEKLNMVMMRDSPNAIRQAEKIIALQDVPEPEVMLEVEILEVKRTKLLELGIQWPDSLTLTPLSPGKLAAGGTSASTASTGLTISDLYHQKSTTIGASISPMTINAHKDDTDANLLANPRIRARNHEKAKILIGERVPNITSTATATGFVSESINYVDVGLTLNVEPTVSLDNDVAIKISLEVSNIVSQVKTAGGSIAYQIGTRTASTVLSLKDGENQVLAGLINDEDRRSGNKVPGLGDLPVLGRLFGTSTDDNQKTEIVLSITPHLVRNIRRPDAAQAEFYSGTEMSYRRRPDTSVRVPATIPAVAANQQGLATNSNVSGDKKANASAANNAPPNAVNSASDNGANHEAKSDTKTTDTGSDTNGTSNDNPASNPPVPAGNIQMEWQGPNQAKVGSTFTVRLSAQSSQPISNLPLTVNFDGQALQVVRVLEGNFLKQGGAQSEFSNQVDASGQITINGSRTGGSGDTGSATVATIVFRALSATDAAMIQVLSAAPTDTEGRSVAVSFPAAQSVQINSN